MYVCIFASELAALLGENQYVSKVDAFEKLESRILKRPNREQVFIDSLSPCLKTLLFKKSGQDSSLEGTKKNLVEINKEISVQIELDIEAEKKKEIVLDKEKMDAETLEAEKMKFEQEKSRNISRIKEKKRELEETAQRIQYTEYGTRNETRVKERFEKELQESTESKDIQITKDDVFRKKLLFHINKHAVYIGGKCDGTAVIDNTKVVVEIKNRMNRLFYKLANYEKIQIYSYMYIYNIKKAILIENYDGATNKINVDFDEQVWLEWMNELKNCLDLFLNRI